MDISCASSKTSVHLRAVIEPTPSQFTALSAPEAARVASPSLVRAAKSGQKTSADGSTWNSTVPPSGLSPHLFLGREPLLLQKHWDVEEELHTPFPCGSGRPRWRKLRSKLHKFSRLRLDRFWKGLYDACKCIPLIGPLIAVLVWVVRPSRPVGNEPSAPAPFTVFVQMPDGVSNRRTLVVNDASPELTVAELESKIEAKAGLREGTTLRTLGLTLTHRGKQLDPLGTLDLYGVEKDATIIITGFCRGGNEAGPSVARVNIDMSDVDRETLLRLVWQLQQENQQLRQQHTANESVQPPQTHQVMQRSSPNQPVQAPQDKTTNEALRWQHESNIQPGAAAGAHHGAEQRREWLGKGPEETRSPVRDPFAASGSNGGRRRDLNLLNPAMAAIQPSVNAAGAGIAVIDLNGDYRRVRQRTEGSRSPVFIDLTGPEHVDRTDPFPRYRTIPRLVHLWQTSSDEQMGKRVNPNYYSDFRIGFGDSDHLDVRYQKLKTVFQAIEDRKRITEHAQPVLVYGREREGKTGAIFSIVKAALLAECAVVVFCAPTKTAPVKDMYRKAHLAAFNTCTGLTHTLARATSDDIPQPAAVPQVMICALTQFQDIQRAHKFIEENWSVLKRKTIVVADEADEILMGKGTASVSVHPQYDVSRHHEYVSKDDNNPADAAADQDADQDGSDEAADFDDDTLSYCSGSASDDENDIDSRRSARSVEVAIAAKYFSESIVKNTNALCFLVTGTQSGNLLNPIELFDSTKVTKVIVTRRSTSYVGILDAHIPEGCEDFRLTMSGTSAESKIFKHGNEKMLEKAFRCEHPWDGGMIRKNGAMQSSSPLTKTLRGMIYVCATNLVYSAGGTNTVAKDVFQYLRQKFPDKQNKTLAVCYVGKPEYSIAGKRFAARRGSSLAEIYNDAADKWRKGELNGVLPPPRDGEPFGSVCPHVVLLGFTLTRRAMTAAFTPADEPNTLILPMYVIARPGTRYAIDILSQRVMRAGHDFGEYDKPDNYKWWISIDSQVLQQLQNYRRMEEKSMLEQAENPRTHANFVANIPAFTYGVHDCSVGKRRMIMGEHLATNDPVRRQTKADEEYLNRFKTWLRENSGLADGTVQTYGKALEELKTRNEEVRKLSDLVDYQDAEAAFPGIVDIQVHRQKTNMQRAHHFLKEFDKTEDGKRAREHREE